MMSSVGVCIAADARILTRTCAVPWLLTRRVRTVQAAIILRVSFGLGLIIALLEEIADLRCLTLAVQLAQRVLIYTERFLLVQL